MSRSAARHGTAAFSQNQDLERLKLTDNGQLYHGHTQGKKSKSIGFDSDAAGMILGAAGCGKLTTLIAYLMQARRTTFFLDLKAELAAIAAMLMTSCNVYCINPYRLFCCAPWFLPCDQRFNVIDFLDVRSLSFFEDARTLAMNLITKPKGGGASEHFYAMSVKWMTGLLMFVREFNPDGSLPDVYNLIGDIESGQEMFEALYHPRMKDSRFANVRLLADEIKNKRLEAPQEYSGIMSGISQSVSILGSPALQMALSGPSTMTFKDMLKAGSINKFFIMIPAHLVEPCAPVIRCIFTAITIEQQRNPQQRISLILDEAAQLGKFDALLRMYSFGRGSNTHVISVWQNLGQLISLYGQDGCDTILGNSQSKWFLSVASEKSADFLSRYLGKTTYQYDAAVRQSQAATKRIEAMKRALSGDNMVTDMLAMMQEDVSMKSPDRVARNLMNADELMRLPFHTGILDISGIGLNPYQFRKYPYFLNPDIAHKFLPNPFLGPEFSTIQLPNRRGKMKTYKVISETVPDEIAHLPQYSGGKWSYIDKHCPIKRKRRFFSFWRAAS